MLRILFGLEGRIGRRNYLLAIVGQWAILTGLFFAFGTALISLMTTAGFDLTPGAAQPAADDITPEQALVASGVGIASLIFIVLVLGFSWYMSTAAQVKRLHDMNMSGWLTLINIAAMPISMSLVASNPANGPIALLVGLLPFGLFLACLFFPGTRGPNKYADDRISVFDLPDGRDGETWADRAQAHRQSLREQQEASRDEAPRGGGSDDDSRARPRNRKRTPPSGAGRGGFGKRGLA